MGRVEDGFPTSHIKKGLEHMMSFQGRKGRDTEAKEYFFISVSPSNLPKGIAGLLGRKGLQVGRFGKYWELFGTLEVLYGTEFLSKNHIMAQLVKVYKVGTTDPFFDLSGHPQGLQRDILWKNKPF